jgi:predicted O-methyltransferase YrrM
MTRDVDLYYEPIEILEKLSCPGAEMSRDQLAFVCGLIREHRPKKIVEVGVAAGGTTAVLLNCLSMLSLDTEFYSVDISEKYYRDKSKETGYLGEESKSFLKNKVNHTRYFGILPDFLDKIGDGIDFIVLDTMHILPGEILDFLASMPMIKGGIVTLHDICLNHCKSNKYSYATRVLLSSVVGEKIICKKAWGIGAFQVTDDTWKYIENVFSALIVTWKYIPPTNQLEAYRKWYSKFYDKELLEEYEESIRLNMATIDYNEKYTKEMLRYVFEFCNDIKGRKNVYIYGCGVYGKKLCRLLESDGILVKGYIVSDNQEKPDMDRNVYCVSEMKLDECTVILGMNSGNIKSLEIDTSTFIVMDEYVQSFLQNF